MTLVRLKLRDKRDEVRGLVVACASNRPDFENNSVFLKVEELDDRSRLTNLTDPRCREFLFDEIAFVEVL